MQIQANGISLFNLSQNTIYGIRQNYLTTYCTGDGRKMYDRHYEARAVMVDVTRRFTIFHTTGYTEQYKKSTNCIKYYLIINYLLIININNKYKYNIYNNIIYNNILIYKNNKY